MSNDVYLWRRLKIYFDKGKEEPKKMTNTNLLKEHINNSGYKRSYIAARLGITTYSLSMKINNESEFKASEMTALSNLLKIDARTRDAIFFAQ